ncbi:hypothetical protein SK128_005322 [Halocaridina rubra]|uniref:BZIP domain-containing protein n=1 Tax=Halocaridina rubra TaxID=373956 RepID=A0AAN8X2J5_HALRR
MNTSHPPKIIAGKREIIPLITTTRATLLSRYADVPADSSSPHSESSSVDPTVQLDNEIAPPENETEYRHVSCVAPANRDTVRIVVNTQQKRERKMVAPALLPKPSHNLIKIPKAEHSANVVRIRRYRAGEKIGPSCKMESSTSEEILAKNETCQPELRKDSPCSSSNKNSNSVTVQQGKSPFWSLKSGRTSTAPMPETENSGTKRKAYELDPLLDPRMERCRRNAINAKKNRELKKAHMEELEQKVLDVSRERDELAGENESLRAAKLKLEQEVKHLNNILKNQSQLSTLIGKIAPSSVILGDLSSSGEEDAVISSGMCLHVDGLEATIEYCSYCAKKAGKKLLI